MSRQIELSGGAHGISLCVRTPEQFAMDVAVLVLEHLDSRPECSVKNTGWKQGFGLEVAAWIPIRMRNSIAELMTDGDEFTIRRVSGALSEFEDVVAVTCEYLKQQPNYSVIECRD